MNLNKYGTIAGIKEFVAGEACDNEYLVEEIAGKLYRIEYVEERSSSLPLYVNISLLGMMIVTDIVLLYVYTKVLKPFQDMSNLSYELAKGNLSMPVKEEKVSCLGVSCGEWTCSVKNWRKQKRKNLHFKRSGRL